MKVLTATNKLGKRLNVRFVFYIVTHVMALYYTLS